MISVVGLHLDFIFLEILTGQLFMAYQVSFALSVLQFARGFLEEYRTNNQKSKFSIIKNISMMQHQTTGDRTPELSKPKIEIQS